MNDCNENINQSTESLIKSSKVPTRNDFKAALKKELNSDSWSIR